MHMRDTKRALIEIKIIFWKAIRTLARYSFWHLGLWNQRPGCTHARFMNNSVFVLQAKWPICCPRFLAKLIKTRLFETSLGWKLIFFYFKKLTFLLGICDREMAELCYFKVVSYIISQGAQDAQGDFHFVGRTLASRAISWKFVLKFSSL